MNLIITLFFQSSTYFLFSKNILLLTLSQFVLSHEIALLGVNTLSVYLRVDNFHFWALLNLWLCYNTKIQHVSLKHINFLTQLSLLCRSCLYKCILLSLNHKNTRSISTWISKLDHGIVIYFIITDFVKSRTKGVTLFTSNYICSKILKKCLFLYWSSADVFVKHCGNNVKFV
jgi:hypothetical protein